MIPADAAPQAGVQAPAAPQAVPDDLVTGVQAIVTLLEGREWADLLPHHNALVLRLWDAVNELVANHNDRAAQPAAQPADAKVVGYLSKTGHGTYFRESITPDVAELEFAGRPLWRPVAYV